MPREDRDHYDRRPEYGSLKAAADMQDVGEPGVQGTADQRAEEPSAAAEGQHDDDGDQRVETEQIGVDVAVVLGLEHPGEAGHAGAEPEGEDPVQAGGDPERLGEH